MHIFNEGRKLVILFWWVKHRLKTKKNGEVNIMWIHCHHRAILYILSVYLKLYTYETYIILTFLSLIRYASIMQFLSFVGQNFSFHGNLQL